MSKKRTKIENIPQPDRDLTPEEEKKIKGGAKKPMTGGGTQTPQVTTRVIDGTYFEDFVYIFD